MTPARALEGWGEELRVRTVYGPDEIRSVLTYKGAVVNEESGSKPEQTRVEDVDA
ncbi:hypothetical protein [Streptomyces sp. NPDC093093]|uniref:hypothetical protein n=1 Tax=Streptomyces sp. NPDC093093 TaxID=3366025 RepID=UPI0038182740